MGYKTNKFDKKREVEAGDPPWICAWADDISETDVALGVVAAGVSVGSANPGPFLVWVERLVAETVTSLLASAKDEFPDNILGEVKTLAAEVIKEAVEGRDAKVVAKEYGKIDFKAGAIKYSGKNTFLGQTISRTWGIKPYVAFRWCNPEKPVVPNDSKRFPLFTEEILDHAASESLLAANASLVFWKDNRFNPQQLRAWAISEGELKTDRIIDPDASAVTMVTANDEWLFFKDGRFNPPRLSAWHIDDGTMKTDRIIDPDASLVSLFAANNEWLFFKDERSNPPRLSAWRIDDGAMKTDRIIDPDASAVTMVTANDEWLFFKDGRFNPPRLSAWHIDDGTMKTDLVLDPDASKVTLIAANDDFLYWKDERTSPPRLSMWAIRM